MNDLQLVTSFVEDNYEYFQAWLEDIHDIEGSEAEVILANIMEKADPVKNGFEVFRIVGVCCIIWTKDEAEVVRSYNQQRRIHTGGEPFLFDAEIVEVEEPVYKTMPSTWYEWRKDLLD